MSDRECDHCDEATAEVMSLIDHAFTGDEVRALNKHFACEKSKRDDRFFVSGQMLALIQQAELNPESVSAEYRCLAAGLRRAMEKDARVSREEAYTIVEAELRELDMEVSNDSRVLWAGCDTLLKATEKYKETQ